MIIRDLEDKTMDDKLIPIDVMVVIIRKGGDIRLFITLVPKVLQ